MIRTWVDNNLNINGNLTKWNIQNANLNFGGFTYSAEPSFFLNPKEN